jgi:hypothetical protein
MTREIYRKLRLVIVAFLVLGAYACSKDEDKKIDEIIPSNNPPEISKPYFIRAKFGDEWKLNQTNIQGMCTGSGVFCYVAANGGVDDVVAIYINVNGSPVAGRILSLAGDTIPFTDEGGSFAEFYWSENGNQTGTDYEADQNDGFFYIEKVTLEGDNGFFETYFVEGSFQCSALNDAGVEVGITEGSYAISVITDPY